MRYADPDELKTEVKKVLGASRLASKFNGVDIESGDYDDEGTFIRVLLHLNTIEDLSDEDVDMLTASIEGAISKYDDRFPSVRFSEP
jgi:hypothetical protein